MGYVDLIPDVFRLTMPDLATGKSYHTQKFNVGNKQCIGVTIKASQALSVAVAYGIATDTAAAAGVDIAASLPYKTSATSFASNTSTEGGTYHEIAVPPHARQAQLVISNASGSTVSGAVIDAALRVVAYPAASGSGSSDFASITGWPGSSSQFVHADGSYSPLSASDIPTGIDAAKIGGGAVSNTEFGYLDGVTSAIQTQFAAKANLNGATFTGDVVIPAANLKPSGSGGSGHFLKQSSSGGAISSAVLAPSDMPARLAIYRRIGGDQAYAGSFAIVAVDYNQEAQDDGGDVSISSGTITFANTGRYRVRANFLTSTACYLLLSVLNYTSGSSNFVEALDYTRADGSMCFGQVEYTYDVTAGDTIKVLIQASTGGNLKYTNGNSVAGGKGCWVQIERIK